MSVAGPIPLPARIETRRLVLRPWCAEDAPGLHEALAESVDHMKPWIPWATADTPTLERVEALVRRWSAELTSGASYIYGVFDHDESRVVGGVGLFARVGSGALEVGYWIRRSETGAGYATEAARAVTHAGFSVRGVTRMEIHTDPRNVASGRVPRKLGYDLVEMRPADRVRDDVLGDTSVFALTRHRYLSEWALD